MPRNSTQGGEQHAYRSGLEEENAAYLRHLGVRFEYETLTLEYLIEETRRYTPDILLYNGIIIELKGRWLTADRKKHKLIHAQYPDLDIRLVFSRPQDRISKQSQTTYARYCETQGWKYAARLIPVEWLREPTNMKSLRCIQRLMREKRR